MKATYNGKEVDVEITDKAVIIDTGNEVIGFDTTAIRAVKKRDNGEIVIAYSTGAKVESITLKPLSDADAANLLLMLGSKDGTAQTVVPNTVFNEEFERLYEKWKNRLENELKLALEGKYRMERQEFDEYFWEHDSMNDIVERLYGNTKRFGGFVVWRVPELPYELQLGWAKYHYLDFLKKLVEIASGYNPLHPDYEVVYVDGMGMDIEDWEKLFLHYGIIKEPIVVGALKEKASKVRKEIEIFDFIIKYNGYPPANYKAWFSRPT